MSISDQTCYLVFQGIAIRYYSVPISINSVIEQPVVPERLLIYHAGTGKTVFIGCLKLTTIFMFSFSCLFIAPALYTAAGQPNWMVAGSVIGGAVPMLFVAYTTSPFVTYIHLRIPQFARHSKDTLMKYSKKVPSDAELVMTTIQFSGRPRTTNMRLSELRSVDRRFGVVNLVRNVSKGTTRPRKLRWLGNGVTQFYVGSGINRVKDDSVLQNVLSTIKKKYV
ncbi:MAG: hypothetical protein M1812_005949 [Candelaria pacifica]|nr:MAG: hypothetical protein M1812_005949 [Candelaria pacifica]